MLRAPNLGRVFLSAKERVSRCCGIVRAAPKKQFRRAGIEPQNFREQWFKMPMDDMAIDSPTVGRRNVEQSPSG